MTFTKSKILNTIYGILLVAFIAFLLTPFYYPRLSDMLYFKFKYNNVHYLDDQKRCVVFELKPSEELKQKKDYKPILKFYDMEKGKFVHLGTDIIHDVKEIRPGYFALYGFLGFLGLQDYSIVMPYASEDYTERMEDEIQVISCIPDEWYRHLETMDNPKLPNNIKEAEALLIKQYEETGQCGDELIDYFRVNQETLGYDFEGIKKKTNISILTSPDKKMRFYTWDTGRGGTSPDFVAFVQYNDGNTVSVGQFTPLTPSKYLTKNKVKRDGYVPYDGAWIDCLYQIDQPDGTPVYLTSAYNKSSSIEGGQDAYAFKVVKGLLEKVPFIDNDGHEVLSVGCLYDIPDWYFKTDGLGWEWVPNFDYETNTFYIPETGDMEMSDRYDKYQLEDGKMKYVGNGAGFWLHPSLHDFKRLCGIYQTKTKFIRIDILPDGQYRYASWSKKNAMDKAPELVIVGAKTDEIENALVFEKDGYEYIVPAYRQGSGDDFGKFIIKKSGKVIQESKV